jgi:hypothetical protein
MQWFDTVQHKKIWRNVYRWGDTEKKLDHTIEHHISHFKRLLGTEGELPELPLNANATAEVKLAKRCRLNRVVLRDLMRLRRRFQSRAPCLR